MKNIKSFSIYSGLGSIAAGNIANFTVLSFTIRENIVIKKIVCGLTCFDSADLYRQFNRASFTISGVLNNPAGASLTTSNNVCRLFMNENKDGIFNGNMIITTGNTLNITCIVYGSFLLNDKAFASVQINYLSY